MKCKVGDMALVVKSVAGNEGKVVTCLEFLGRGPFTIQRNGITIFLADLGDVWWRVDRNLNMYVEFDNGVSFTEPDHSPFVMDKSLMPISGVPQEETINEASTSLV